MKPKPSIPVSAAGFCAPSILDAIKSAAPIAWEGAQKLMKGVQRTFSSGASLEDCQRAVFRMIAWDDNGNAFHSGTAFLVSAQGHIVSHCSIVHGCTKFAVAVRHAGTGELAWLMAAPILVDPAYNLAVFFVIQQQNFVLPAPLAISQTPPKVSDMVVAVGFPSMSSEFILGGGLDVNKDENFTPYTAKGTIREIYATHIEHGAQIAQANCGEPVISQNKGEIVGMNSLGTLNDGSICPYTLPARYISDLLDGKSGMSYDEYLARCAQSRNRPLNIHENLEECQRAVFRMIAWDENSQTYYTGTAFLISENGLITNFHVIEGCSHFVVNVPNADTGCIEQLSANLEIVDPEHDLALLSLDQIGHVFPMPLPISPDTHSLGEDVVAIGFPASVYQALDKPDGDPTCTFGKINKLDDSKIVHGATIGPGNSGGPLISSQSGTVIGVNTWTSQGEYGGVFFMALPARYILDLLKGKSGISYKEYLTRYPMDKQAGEIIVRHLDFLTAKAIGHDTKFIYADKLTDKGKNVTMTRGQFENAVIKLDNDWPIRRYEIVSVKRSGNTLEALCQYNRESRKGVKEGGYAMFTLVWRGDLITAFSEKRSGKPIKHTSRFKEILYVNNRNRIFKAP